jgi:hypothetical protein
MRSGRWNKNTNNGEAGGLGARGFYHEGKKSTKRNEVMADGERGSGELGMGGMIIDEWKMKNAKWWSRSRIIKLQGDCLTLLDCSTGNVSSLLTNMPALPGT